MEWSGRGEEWSREECIGEERSKAEQIREERSRAEWRGVERRGNERSGLEWSSVVRSGGCVAPVQSMFCWSGNTWWRVQFGFVVKIKKGTRTSFCLCLVGDNNPISLLILG